MSEPDRRAKGMKVMREMHGEERAEAVCRKWQQMCPDLERFIVEFVAGDIWDRPGLDRRTKSLVTIAVLTALGRTVALEHNIRKAPNNGVTREDVVDTLIHLAPYAGFPACWEGMEMAHKVFQEADQK
jgi:4-carboxymuconolactone decarboxylase